MFGRFASARVVLLGEATEGTSEFQRARAAITRRLIVAHGFNILAVDMDWQDAAAIDRFVGGVHSRGDAADALPRGANWRCMNAEFAAFAAWLRRYNDAAPAQRHAGFYGLDRYNSDRALHTATHYLDGLDPDAAALARARHGELASSFNEPARHVHTPRGAKPPHCTAVAAMLGDLLDEDLDSSLRGGRDYLDTLQRQSLTRRADAYYRAMYNCSPSFWNMREQHMFETLMQLLGWKGPDAKAVIWAHNAHVGDARYTEMGWLHDEINLGQLCREWFGDDAQLIGFGANAGTVAAADDWDGPMKTTQVAPAPDNTYERLMHGSGVRRFLVDLRRGVDDRLRAALDPPRLERFIGAVYRPDADDRLHYASASLPHQFDAYVWFDASRAVRAVPERGDAETMRGFGSQANAR
jgi:erythromycin esterase-like protein